jgi:hypothetical protein
MMIFYLVIAGKKEGIKKIFRVYFRINAEEMIL